MRRSRLQYVSAPHMHFRDAYTCAALQNPSRETSPNRGSSVPQAEAIPKPCKPLRQWQEEQKIDRTMQIKLTKLVHMRYQHPRLDDITTFLRDFGMSVAHKVEGKKWYKGGTETTSMFTTRNKARRNSSAAHSKSRATRSSKKPARCQIPVPSNN
jgi:hypothetical protein